MPSCTSLQGVYLEPQIPEGVAELIECPVPHFGDRGIRTHGFSPWPSQTDATKVDTYYFLGRVFSEYDQDCLTQYKNKVTEWYIKTWCCRAVLSVGQPNKVAMCASWHKTIPDLI